MPAWSPCQRGRGAGAVAVLAWRRWPAGAEAAAEWGDTPPPPFGYPHLWGPPHARRGQARPGRGESPWARGAAVGSAVHPAPRGDPAPCLSFPRRRRPGLPQPPGTEPPGTSPNPPQAAHIPPPRCLFLGFPFSLPILHPLAPSHAAGPGVPVPPEPGSATRPRHASSAPLSAARRGCPGSAGAPIKILCEV